MWKYNFYASDSTNKNKCSNGLNNQTARRRVYSEKPRLPLALPGDKFDEFFIKFKNCARFQFSCNSANKLALVVVKSQNYEIMQMFLLFNLIVLKSV